jgi:hypothetical protein
MMDEELELEPADERLSDTVLCVRYNGDANSRTISARELSGSQEASENDLLIWTPGAEIEWEKWEAMAGSRERALAVLTQQAHEFSLVGPGAEELQASNEVVEFEVGGSVE